MPPGWAPPRRHHRDPAAAQATIDAFIAAYNAGDTDGTLALMSPDEIMTTTFGRPDPGNDPQDVELNFAWTHAQGELWTEPTCGAPLTPRPAGTTMSCHWDTRDALIQAVDGDPIPTDALIVVENDLIVELHLGYGTPDFNALGIPFDAWMETSQPEVEGTGCCAGNTREESELRGDLFAQWAGEWATWLDEWECGPSDCRLTTAELVAEYDARCTELEPSDVPSADFVERIRLLPSTLAPSQLVAARQGLLDADAALLATDLIDARVAELQQDRLDAMIVLGIDERCHPTVG